MRRRGGLRLRRRRHALSKLLVVVCGWLALSWRECTTNTQSDGNVANEGAFVVMVAAVPGPASAAGIETRNGGTVGSKRKATTTKTKKKKRKTKKKKKKKKHKRGQYGHKRRPTGAADQQRETPVQQQSTKSGRNRRGSRKAAVLGAHPDDNSRYEAPSFQCGDNNIIPSSLVNDDFCDCDDGSDEPGTAACSARGVQFTCSDFRVPVSFSTSFVNDGICDCCDGSDEYASGAVCRNTCLSHARAEKERLLSKSRLHSLGTAKQMNQEQAAQAQQQFIQFRSSTLEKISEDLKKKQAELQQVNAWIQNQMQIAIAKHQESGNAGGGARFSPDPRAIHHQHMLKQQLGVIQYHERSLSALDHSVFGARMRFFPMFDTCYTSPDVGEKELKGGTPNIIPQIYRFEVCPFRHVSQVEINHSAWEEAEKAAKLGRPADGEDSTATFEIDAFGAIASAWSSITSFLGFNGGSGDGAARADGLVASESAPQRARAGQADDDGASDPESAAAAATIDPASGTEDSPAAEAGEEVSEKTLLGTWVGWDESGFDKMYFSGGQPCTNGIGTGDVQRAVTVRLECGESTKISSVEENGLCQYTLALVSPLACDESRAEQLRKDAEAVL